MDKSETKVGIPTLYTSTLQIVQHNQRTSKPAVCQPALPTRRPTDLRLVGLRAAAEVDAAVGVGGQRHRVPRRVPVLPGLPDLRQRVGKITEEKVSTQH